MTDLSPPRILSDRALLKRDIRLVVATLAACVSIAYAAHTIAGPQMIEHDPRIERLMRAACQLPTNEGEATTYAVAEGKLFCWQMK